jgi:hypothetical protein
MLSHHIGLRGNIKMKLIYKIRWVIFETVLFMIVAILYVAHKSIGTVAFWVWILLLAGVPLCIGECFGDKT